MAKYKQQKIRAIRGNRGWISLILFTVILIVNHVLMAVLADVWFTYEIDNQLSQEFLEITEMSKAYQESVSAGDNHAVDTFCKEGKTFVIKDAEGALIAGNGKDTCGEEGFLADGFNSIEDIEDTPSANMEKGFVYIYPDTEKSFIKVDKTGVSVDIQGFKLNNTEEEPDEVTMEFIKRQTIDSPVWLGTATKDGSAKIYYKVNVSLRIISLAYIVLAVVVLWLSNFLVFLVMFINVITSFANHRRLTNLFLTDEVTGGPNWMHFLYKGERMLHRRSSFKQRYAVINLLFVKYRNYCMCHSVEQGERAICKVNHIITSHLGKRDICAHAASASFAILMRCKDEDEALRKIHAMLPELEKIDPVHKFSFHVGVKLIDLPNADNGGNAYRKKLDLEKEYNDASAARSGLDETDESGVSVFNAKMVEEQQWIDIVHEKQQTAIDHEEFLVYYQPKYDPQTGALKGAEALIRWESPEYGFVSPGRIIPIFEKNGFITEIDHYMISHAARDQKRWLDAGYSCVPVSVNVSRAHFVESDLAEQIRDMVDAEGTPRELIEIELTESAFFDDKKALITTIERLKEYGFSVSMDDFGSGYSSLNSLKDMPLDVLKLDAEFFRGDADPERQKIVVAEAISLAKNLGMRIVAEGVEVKEQVDFLAKQECDMIQGYYYSKPLPKDEYETRMQGGE